jgi:hypothetical protein
MSSTNVTNRTRRSNGDHSPARIPPRSEARPLLELDQHARRLISPEDAEHYVRAGERLGSALIDFSEALQRLFGRTVARPTARRHSRA